MSTDVVSDTAPLDAGVPHASGPSSDSQPSTVAADSASTPASNQCSTDVKEETAFVKPAAPFFLHSPPDSNNATKSDASDSELSELEDEPILDDAPSASTPDDAATSAPAATSTDKTAEQAAEEQKVDEEEEEDIGEVLPDDWSGAVPIFRPTFHQFKDFQKFMKKVDRYGMKSGIIKIIPPKEWKDAQPPLDDLVKQIRVREPIKQDIMGSNGTYRQVNILHGRSYNVPQWRQLCEQSEHQPPARRGERRANADKPKQTRSRPTVTRDAKPTTPKKRGRGRPAKNKGKKKSDDGNERPMTPVSPKPELDEEKDRPVESVEQEIGEEIQEDDEPSIGRMGGRMGRAKPAKPKTQSVSARRKYSRREGSAMIDEAAFKDFDYRMDISDYTPERCEELERAYWKTLTYAAPLYGADMMGTLFDERTDNWNLNKLPNLLDVLGTKIPGVNTAYLYLGMWKATFAWHLEDVDLYSINYLHFGAPKQWYSISQADARRFEGAMKSVWPADAKACSQFLRHKGFLISPHHLLQHYGIKVNKVVSYPGEFVVTYPYGYHSGYNLGYNCAEAVNFALDTWLEMGKIAKRCECAQAQDSVWINVHEIERKLRGEETEYEETEDDEDDDEEEDDELSGLPTPPAGHGVKMRDANRKRKRGPTEKKTRVKRVRLRLKTKAEPPCCLCPNDISHFDVLATDDGRKAHKLCALYIPETYIDSVDGNEVICNVKSVHKDRQDLKCLLCRSRRGACFQCSHQKCARAYHATCAVAAGVFVEEQDIPVFDEDGTEYKEQAFEFSCRFHRVRRDRKIDANTLEMDARIRSAANELKTGELCQLQYLKGDIFAGIVVENRQQEEMLLVDVLPHGDRLEVEWKWLVLPDPADYHLPKASATALPMPASRKAKDKLNTKRIHADKPRKDDLFAEGYTWAEFELYEVSNKEQVKVDFTKPDQIWHYLGRTSTEAKAQYTEDPAQQRHNPKSNFLDTIPKPPRPAPISKPTYNHQSYLAKAMAYSYSLAGSYDASTGAVSFKKPYIYKPRKPAEANHTTATTFATQHFAPNNAASAGPAPEFREYNHQTANFIPQPAFQEAMSQNQSISHAQPVQTPQPVSHTLPQSHQYSHQNPANGPTVQQSKPVWQVHSSVYQKYPFFQVNYNRDVSKYRTPYSPWGGFTNGYEGDSRARIVANRNEVMRQSTSGGAPIIQGAVQQFPQVQCAQGQQPQVQQPQIKQTQAGVHHLQVHQPHIRQTQAGVQHPQVQQPQIQKPESGVHQPQVHQLPAQQSQHPPRPPSCKPKPAAAAKLYKVPAKVSPVPLPPHILAAMAQSCQGQQCEPSEMKSTVDQASPAGSHSGVGTVPAAGQPSAGAATSHLGPPNSSPQPVVANSAGQYQCIQQVFASAPAEPKPQDFADVPGSDSMQFVERLMQNLRRASMNGGSGEERNTDM